MDLNFLDTSSKVTPLLVRLYDSHKLYGLARDKKPDARAELSTAITELLDLELSARESELVADVLISLVRQAEKDLRQALSDKLSLVDNVPLRLALQLANDDIEIAAPILRNSNALGDLDLIYIIKSKPSDYWREIAKRKEMSDHVIETLALTGDIQTAINLAENTELVLSETVMNVMADLAQGEEALAAPLIRRDEVSPELAAQLYQYVGQELKKYISSHFNIDHDHALDAVDDIVTELQDVSCAQQYAPSAAALRAAERFMEKGLLTSKLMVSTLKRGQIASFIAQFSKFSDLDPEMVYEILTQKNGQALAVVCRALDVKKPDFVSIFLSTNLMRTAEQKISIKDMNKALRYFDKVEVEVAKEIMKNSLKESLNSDLDTFH